MNDIDTLCLGNSDCFVGSYSCMTKIVAAPLCCEIKRQTIVGHGWRNNKLAVTNDEFIEKKVSVTCSVAFYGYPKFTHDHNYFVYTWRRF